MPPSKTSPAPAKKSPPKKDASEPPATDGILRVYCNSRRNFAPVTLDETRSTTQDMGGHRISVVCGKNKAVFYNKKIGNEDSISAVWFARLKAVECMKEWNPGVKHFYVCDDQAEYVTTNRSSPSVRYRYIADQHAQKSGFTYELLRVSAKENIAKEANIPNAPHYFTEEAKEQLAARQAGERIPGLPGAEDGGIDPEKALGEISKLLLQRPFAEAVVEHLRDMDFHENAAPLAEALAGYTEKLRIADEAAAETPEQGESEEKPQRPKRSARV